MAKGKLYGIGVGPGDPELLTLKALRLLKECPVIGIPGKNPSESVAFNIAKGAYPEIERKQLLLLETPMTKDRDILDEGYEKAADQIIECLDQGKDVVVVTLGDTTVYSTYIYMQRNVAAKGYEVETVPGITSFCAVSAYLNDSLVDRDEMLHVIPASYQIDDALELSGTKVLMKAASKMPEVKKVIKEKNQKAIMMENCGMENQMVYTSVDDIPDSASYYSLTIIKER
ncbi:MAG: precorrin-2 C(20)-methyltransferase [Lachnospiraceae bacterium]|nr:precorrin-2 C(20)-methyltransferase [Lachnospiraceae bacterium]